MNLRDRASAPLGTAVTELVAMSATSAIRWFQHDYPHPLARWHFHEEIEVHLITESQGIAYVGNKIRPFRAGQIWLIGSMTPHHWISENGGITITNRDALVQFHPNLLSDLASSVPDLEQLTTLLDDSERSVVYSGASAASISKTLLSIPNGRPICQFASFLTLLQDLLCAADRDKEFLDSFGLDFATQGHNANLLRLGIEYIQAHYAEDIRLEDVAHIMRVSTSTASRLFSRSTTIGFSGLLTRIRVAEACRLLSSTRIGIAEIAASVGYNNLSNFNRRFLSEIGMTPSTYRKTINFYNEKG